MPWDEIPRWFWYVLRDRDHGLLRLAMMEAFYDRPSTWHSHLNVQALVVVEGSIVVEFHDAPPVALGPGDGLAIPADVRHRAGPAGEQRRLIGIELRLVPQPPGDLYRHLAAGNRPFTWRCHRPTFLRSVAELQRLGTRGIESPGPELIRAVWGFCVTEAHASASARPPANARVPGAVPDAEMGIDRRVLYVERQMRSFMHQPYSAHALAESIHVSESQMNRLFNQHRGTSPLRRFQAIRLEQAGQYLTYSTLSIKEIAQRCGFAGADHFARIFRLQFRQSPRDYRAQHQVPAASPT